MPSTTDHHPLVATLTLEQKVSLLSGGGFWETAAVPGARVATLTDGPHGVRRQSDDPDHLGINDSQPATAFPTASATACSWDRGLLREIGGQLAVESRERGVDVLLGPGVNIKRHPLCGRNFEYFSEDPLLAGDLAAAWVQGLQAGGVGASVKHFAVNNQETDRMTVDAQVDEATLRGIYLHAFERVVRQAQPATMMASYNKINGVSASQNHWLLTEVLRDDWGFDGAVMSDWGAVGDPVAAVAAGLDLEMPSTGGGSARRVLAAVRAGELDEAVVDVAASRVLHVVERWTTAEQPATASDSAQVSHALARRAAAQSAVLLKNDGLLPIDAAGVGRVAVVGEFARTPRYQGGGSSHITPTALDTALDAIRAGTDREVDFAAGFTLDGDPDDALVAEAVAAARGATDVLVFLGLPEPAESESFDRSTIDLPADQLELLVRLAAVSDRITVVLSNGGVVTTEPWQQHVGAVLEMWLGGQAAGSAAADLLLGRATPSGKLAETVPVRLEDTPAFLNFPGTGDVVRYGERHYVGYRWYDVVDRPVAYPFGHGLSYTTFVYEELTVVVDGSHLDVRLTVRNTGDRAGAEVVQLYAAAPAGTPDRPLRTLIGFDKVEVPAGGTTPVHVRVALSELDTYDPATRAWSHPGGGWTIAAAASSRDIRLTAVVELASTEQARGLTLASSLGEWFARPSAAAALTALFGELGPIAGTSAFDPDTYALVAPIPVGRLLGMMLGGQGVQLPPGRLDQLLVDAGTVA